MRVSETWDEMLEGVVEKLSNTMGATLDKEKVAKGEAALLQPRASL